MNIKEYFALAKNAGIEEAQLTIVRTKDTSIETYNGKLEQYAVSDNQTAVASGIYEGKYGSVRTDRLDKDVIPWLVEEVIKAAKAASKPSEVDFFEGSKAYVKKRVYSKAVSELSPKTQLKVLYGMENEARAKDARITNVFTSFEKVETRKEIHNSKGLDLVNKKNFFSAAIALYGKDGEEVRNSDAYIIDLDPAKFDSSKLVDEAVDELQCQFGAKSCRSGLYPTVIKNSVFGKLVDYVVAAASGEQIQKKSSFLLDKLGEKVSSRKITISEKPLSKNAFFDYFDAEGVARQDKDIVSKGILKTYLYNRETAKKDGVESTGNAEFGRGKIGIGYTQIYVRPGRLSFEEMIAPIGEGVYITSIQGLGTGMNEINGDFSCQASGFKIRNGKLAEPLSLITLSGNLLKMLLDVRAVDNRVRMEGSGISSPDVYVCKMAIGGE